jgi:hypothetical protein
MSQATERFYLHSCAGKNQLLGSDASHDLLCKRSDTCSKQVLAAPSLMITPQMAYMTIATVLTSHRDKRCCCTLICRAFWSLWACELLTGVLFLTTTSHLP